MKRRFTEEQIIGILREQEAGVVSRIFRTLILGLVACPIRR